MTRGNFKIVATPTGQLPSAWRDDFREKSEVAVNRSAHAVRTFSEHPRYEIIELNNTTLLVANYIQRDKSLLNPYPSS
jgi:hypothetical protein